MAIAVGRPLYRQNEQSAEVCCLHDPERAPQVERRHPAPVADAAKVVHLVAGSVLKLDGRHTDVAHTAYSSSCSNIHDVPNRSRSIANRFAKNVCSIFMKI